MKIAFTVCNRHQLRHALTLGESLLRHNPGYRFMIGWTDSAPLPDSPDWVRVIGIRELEGTPWPEMAHRYYDFELTAACKPFFARHILSQNPRSTELIYLAPTVWVLGALSPVLDPKVFFRLTPHRLQPIAAPGYLDDKAILNIGMYHAGSWVLHPDGQEQELLDWWCERTADRAFFDLCQGMCLDQLWMNYLPVLFRGVRAIRHAGWHFGLHAIPGHHLSGGTGSPYRVDQQPLISVDFAGLECYHPIWTDHAALAEVALWAQLRAEYRAQLAAQAAPRFDSSSAPYGKAWVVKSHRKQRKRVVAFLDGIIDRIETYDLTYN